MSLVPAFQIGLWNAWIFVLGLVVIGYGLGSLIVSKEATLFMWPQYSEREKKLTSLLMMTIFALWIYGVFLPLKLGTAWFYAGLVIYLLGMIFLTMAILNFATTTVNKPVTKGAFRISRHPMNFSWFLIFIGIACASWIFLLIAIVFTILQQILEIPEERWCLERFGDAYREYMNKTPKFVGIPKSRGK